MPAVTAVTTVKDACQRPTVSINEACALTGVSRRTVYNWINAKKIETIRTAGGSVRIFTDTLWRTPNGEFLNQS